MKKIYSLIILVLFVFGANAQDGCSTIPTQQQIDYLTQTKSLRQNWSQAEAIIWLPVQNHIITETNGSGGLVLSDVQQIMSTLNTYYANSNIQFYECSSINYINNSTYYDFDQSQESVFCGSNDVIDVINIYYFNSVTSNSGSSLCGYAYFPPGPDRVIMKNSCAINGSTIVHELGHYLSLYHTHGPTNTGTTELVNGSNCSWTGDDLCDTPADPNLSGLVSTSCQYTGTAMDANGQAYVPDPTNIMSYSQKVCRTFLSSGQYNRANYSAINDRSYLTCNTAGCLPTSGVFWQEDFSNGIPANWQNTSTPWVYRGTNTNPNNSVGSQGGYVGINGPIVSPTSSNGFVIFDSDYYDNGGNQGAFGTGMYPTPHIGHLTTDVIDLSQYTDVRLKFNSFFRTYAGEAFVEFSINGGATFGSAVQIHANLAINEGTIADEVVSLNLPVGIAGNSNVKIRFIFEGQTNNVGVFTGYYFWMIDDIELMETPTCEFSILDVNYGGWYTSGTGGIDFTRIPLSQVNSNSFLFEANIANTGTQDQTNTKLNVSVNNSQYFNSTPSTLVTSDTSIFNISNPAFSPNTIGSYQIDYYASSDDITSSDTTSLIVEVTDSVYGFDNEIAGGSWGVGRQCGGMQLGNIFEVFNTDSITSASAHITEYSLPGAQMFATLYEVDTNNFNTPIWLTQTNDYTITANDTNNWVTLSFNQPFLVQQGFYMVAIGGYQHSTDTLGISNSTTNARLEFSKLFDNNGCFGSSNTWYNVNKVPMIRANFGNTPQVSWDCVNGSCIDPGTGQGTYTSLAACQSNCIVVTPTWDCDGQGNCNDPGTGQGTYTSLAACQSNCLSTSIEEIDLKNISIYPNPNSGIFTIEFTTSTAIDVSFSVVNVLGQEIILNKIKAIVGINKQQFDLSGFAKGVYTLKLISENGVMDKKVVLE